MSTINQITVGSTTYDIEDMNAVPSSRTVNGLALSSNITLEGDKIRTTIWDTDPNVDQPFYIDDELRDINNLINTLISQQVPNSRTINGHALSSNITLTASDVNALSSNALANRNLYYTNVACAANTGDIATVSNAAISSNHVVAEISFAKPSYITTDVTWTTSSGSLVLSGTCTNATTANILLVLKDN